MEFEEFMDQSMDEYEAELTQRKTWEQLYAESPEAVEASRVAWYTIPRAKMSVFQFSSMPRGNYRRISRHQLGLPFKMLDLALSGGAFTHLDLEALAEKAERRVQWEKPGEQRSRLLKGEAEKRPNLSLALKGGIPTVFRLAGLTPSQERVAQKLLDRGFLGAVEREVGLMDRVIAADLSLKTSDSARARRSEVTQKLRALAEEGQ